MILNIITRCTRPSNLEKIKNTINTKLFNIVWYIVFDTLSLKDIDCDLLFNIQNIEGKCNLIFKRGDKGDFGHRLINETINDIHNGFIYILDDDNIIHEDFYKVLYHNIMNFPNKEGFVFNQKIDGKDFTGLDIRICSPENMKRSKIDMAQVVLHRYLIGETRLNHMNYISDSIFIEELYNNKPEKFHFIDQVLCYYNFLQKKQTAKLPKVLYIGNNRPVLKSNKRAYWESDSLESLYKNSLEITDLVNFDPDVIVSVGDNLITNVNFDIKKKLIRLNQDNDVGEISYNTSMSSILERYNRGLISFFTPIYNTGDKLRRTYESISNQTYDNWEWIIVNDSTDGGYTLKIAEEIAKSDYRVKVYDFRVKSGGVIGESKYRAAMLCRGDILVEMDHDDFVLPWSCETLLKAFEKYPDAGFAYTDCVEISEDWKTMRYPEGFCFGYGKYRVENTMDIDMDVNISPNINPKTIRHIVGVPNHIRAWKRDIYLKIGGHNRRLSIADDYEIIIRTFLETKFIRIEKNCYLQFIYNNSQSSNTHELSRADIQRRVRSISEFYNYKISKRFSELGVEDWAFKENPTNPLLVPSRYNSDEGFVNFIYK